MDLHSRYPAIHDLRRRARGRIPHFVWEYLDSATGTESTARRNRTAMIGVEMMPSVLHGELEPDLTASLMGRTYPLPFGVAPVGMSGLIWPGAEAALARAATAAGLPYTLSTVATRTPEEIGPLVGGNGWFQLYPPRDPEIRRDMLRRARETGFSTLVLTADVPVASRRERQVRSGLTLPPRLTPRLLAQIALRPGWAMGTLRHGTPRLATVESYASDASARDSTAHIGYLLRTSPDWDYLRWLRDAWQGSFVVKGVLNPEDAEALEKAGIDAVWVSNHAGRQFDAAPAALSVLPEIRAATSLPVIYDGGIEGGLDICRAIAKGADFVMLGRAWHYALGALGRAGPDHLIDVLRQDMLSNMGQLGAAQLSDLWQRLR